MALLDNDIRISSITAPTHRYNNAVITSGSAVSETMVDIIGNELSIDNFSLIVRYVTPRDIIYAPQGKQGYLTADNKVLGVGKVFVSLYAPWGKDGYKTSDGKVYSLANGNAKDYLTDLVFGTPVWWYCDSSFFVKGYVKSVERVGKYSWKINCVSGIGLLAEKMHGGGLYNGTTVGTIVNSIIGGSFGYSIANDVANITVYGHLPYDTARNNLHRVLFSCGAIIKRGTQYNDYTIGFPDNTVTVIPASRIAMGGSVNYQLPSNTVEVTEHSFFKTPNDKTVTLFDNSASVYAEHLLVQFREAPVYDLQASDGLTVVESGVNYAIVSGYGILSGKPYAHVQRIVRISEKADTEPERIKRVDSNELISSVNSNNVARRVLNYYKSSKTVKAKIMLANESCGAVISTVDAFGDSVNAIIRKMSVKPTTVKGADCELVDGYTPGNNGNNYQHAAVISASGTWTVPAGVNQIRVALIGGGQGGQGGACGAGGEGTDGGLTYYNTKSGDYTHAGCTYYNQQQATPQGGAGGTGGAAGNVCVFDKRVNEGETLTIAIGVGGAGGAGAVGSYDRQSSPGSDGAFGTDTTVSGTFGSLSSASGGNSTGYNDPISGTTYALDGDVGIDGANGGRTDTQTDFGDSGNAGLPGGNLGDYTGGAGGAGYKESKSYDNMACSGGGGGGAAYGANGGNGTAGRKVWPYDMDGGAGGDGANAADPANTTAYGHGGTGGNGGGGGGNGGGVETYEYQTENFVINGGKGGKGGNGSAGGKGGDGAAIIYF